MTLREFKTVLSGMTEVRFQLPNGRLVPEHFHVTEVGGITKDFIDCGGTIRHERSINFQLWEAEDFDHRLGAQKLLAIIQLSEDKLGLEDGEIEVEYQAETIGKYGVEYRGGLFALTAKKTDCLAKDNCGIPVEKKKVSLASLTTENKSCCTPGSGCC